MYPQFTVNRTTIVIHYYSGRVLCIHCEMFSNTLRISPKYSFIVANKTYIDTIKNLYVIHIYIYILYIYIYIYDINYIYNDTCLGRGIGRGDMPQTPLCIMYSQKLPPCGSNPKKVVIVTLYMTVIL